jgi:hypothetical protein
MRMRAGERNNADGPIFAAPLCLRYFFRSAGTTPGSLTGPSTRRS